MTGRHEYTCDITRQGMLHGAVLRAPAPSAVLGAANTTAAETMKGVRVVKDGDFVGVAPTSVARRELVVLQPPPGDRRTLDAEGIAPTRAPRIFSCSNAATLSRPIRLSRGVRTRSGSIACA